MKLKNKVAVIYGAGGSIGSAGVGLSSGDAPTTVADAARDAETFIDALRELHFTDPDWVSGHVDLLGLSFGGLVAQQLAQERPDIVERVILAGRVPEEGDGFEKKLPSRQPVLVLARGVGDTQLVVDRVSAFLRR